MLSDEVMRGRFGEVKSHSHSHKFGSFHHLEAMRDQRAVTRVIDRCSVDIIIPYHGQYDLVRRALLSILRHTRSNPYQVTLVDDGSKGAAAHEFLETISQAPQTQCVRIEEQQGFGAAINAGLSKTTQPYVCIMHSDCEIMHINWLSRMGEALVENKDKGVRMVSALSDNPGENHESLAMEYNEFNKMTLSQSQIDIATDPLPMYCCLCHRGLFNRIGGIRNYPYTWFENEELFYRMKFHNFRQAIANYSWIKHEGSATVKALLQTSEDAKSLEDEMYNNRQRCIKDLRELYETNKA